MEEEGLSLARLHIPGLTRSYIERLVKEGYEDEDCLEEVGEKELGEVLPTRLVRRIQERIKEKKVEEKEEEIRKEEEKEERAGGEERGEEGQEQGAKKEKEKREVKVNDEMEMIAPVLVIDQHRPDRIIFEEREIEVTAKEFSLIFLLAQHNNQVMRYDEILDELWKDEEDAIYNRVSFHVSKIRRTILKTIGKRKINEEKVKNIFVVVPNRGVILKLKAEEIRIN